MTHIRPAPPSPQPPGPEAGEVSLVSLVNVVLRYRTLVVGTAVALATLLVGWGLLTPRVWSSSVTFVPQARQTTMAGLSGLAAQLGVSVGTSDAMQSPAFYGELLRSRAILGTVVDSALARSRSSARPAAVAEFLTAEAPRPGLRRELGIATLDRSMDVSVSPKTGVIRMTVHAPEPAVARELADWLIGALVRFNLETRQSNAAAERRFTEQRLDQVRTELRAAEGQLKDFLQRNRSFESPELRFERDRLAREVSLRNELYSSLSQAFERARIDEVRDTPVLTVIEQPEQPVRPDPRGLARKGLLALISGAMLGVLFGFVADFMRSRRGAAVEEQEELAALLRDTRRGARRPWVAVGRLFGVHRGS